MTFADLRIRRAVAVLSLVAPLIVLPGEAIAGQLTLTWTDTSTNELGFAIERSMGSTGSFFRIGTIGAGATTYTDSTVPDDATYCYRVLAFNAYGDSDYTNTACGSVQPGAVVTVMPNGSGTGTVTSSPPGISCGVSCSASFASGTMVTLSYTPTSGSAFSGWSGGGCSGTGTCTVTVTAATTVVATFTAQSPNSPSAPGAPGLVAAYSFSQGTGNTVTDLSGNNNTGTIAGATWAAGGRFGSALFFNGSSYVTVPDTSSLDFTGGMTLEAWVYPTAPQSYWSTVIMKEQPGQFTYVLYAGSPDNRPHVFFNVGDSSSGQRGVAGSSGLPINTWTHLAGTYDGSTQRLYVNGALVASQDISGLMTTSNGALRIGGNAVWGEYFQGFIDEVRVYNRALSVFEIQSDMDSPVGSAPSSAPPLGDGLVAAYNFNENGGNAVTDLAGGGYTISLAGEASWEAGRNDTALSFNGTTAYGTVGSFPSLSTWTVSAWIMSPAAPSGSPASGPVHREANFQITWDHPSPTFRGAATVNVGGTWYAASFGALAADTWYHLTATYDGETLNAYTNGVLITSNSAPFGSASSDPNPLTFGKHAAAPQFFQGTVDDVRIYDRALSIPEIQFDMNTTL